MYNSLPNISTTMSDTKFLSLTMKGLSIFGLQPNLKFDSPIKNILYFLWGSFIYYLVIIFNIAQIIAAIHDINDLFLVIQNLMVTLLYFLAVIKVMVIVLWWNKLETLFDKIRFEEKRFLTKNEQKILLESYNFSKFMTKLFWYVVLATVVTFNMGRPLEYWYDGPQEHYHYRIPFLVSVWYPFDEYKGNNFIIAYVLNSSISGVIAAIISISDALYIGLIMFGTGHFKVMQQSIKDLHLVHDENGDMVEIMNGDDLIDPYEDIVRIIQHHNRINEYYYELDKIMRPVTIVKFGITSFMICAVGLEGILTGASIRLIIDFEYLLALIVEVFLYYWFANEIILESSKVASAVAESKWYKFSTRVKKSLLILMMRCKRPSKITIGGFFDMSLESFVVLMKSAYSFMTLLLNMYQNKD